MRDEPAAEPHPLVSLQRTVGNQAVARMLARYPDGRVPRTPRIVCELAILFLELMQRGEADPRAGLPGRHQVIAHEVQLSLLRASRAIQYWFRRGCMHVSEAGVEVVRPAPAHAIASWIPNVFAPDGGAGPLCPECPRYLPIVPEEYEEYLAAGVAQAQNATAPVRRVQAPAALRGFKALIVATYMIENYLLGDPHPSAGLSDPELQDLAMKIADHLLLHNDTFTYLTSYGAAHVAADGSIEWPLRPSGEGVAILMGVGPDDNPEAGRWLMPGAS